jgi:N-acetyl-anhydromuramyl-L-alanine amidase AmpD
MSDTKHTLNYRIGESNIPDQDELNQRRIGIELEKDKVSMWVAVIEGDSMPDEEQEKFAQVLTHRYNTHPALLAALEELLAIHDMAANDGPRPHPEEDICDLYKRVENMSRRALSTARA